MLAPSTLLSDNHVRQQTAEHSSLRRCLTSRPYIAAAPGASLLRMDSPRGIPTYVDLVLVDWSAPAPEWGDALTRSMHR